MTKSYPWEYHGDLTSDRLTTVGRLIADGRQAAVERNDAEAGDNSWTLGCSAFQFARFRILAAVDGDDHPWLTAIDRSMQLIFKIGQVPVRIYKGDADEPTGKTLHQTFGELRQLDFLFSEEDDGRDLAYRFAVETDFDGSVLAVKFVGLKGSSPAFMWDVPLDAVGTATGTVGRPATEVVQLDAPAVGHRKSDVGNKGGEA